MNLDKIIEKMDKMNLPPLGAGLCLLGGIITYFGGNNLLNI